MTCYILHVLLYMYIFYTILYPILLSYTLIQRCNYIIEHDIVRNNLLGRFHPLVAFVVADEKSGFGHPLLRETAILALCRYVRIVQYRVL